MLIKYSGNVSLQNKIYKRRRIKDLDLLTFYCKIITLDLIFQYKEYGTNFHWTRDQLPVPKCLF